METADTARREIEDEIKDECLAASVAHTIESKPLGLLQVNCRSIYNKAFDFWIVIDTYDPAAIGTESWLSEEVNNAEVSRADYTTFKRDRHSRGEGVLFV